MCPSCARAPPCGRLHHRAGGDGASSLSAEGAPARRRRGAAVRTAGRRPAASRGRGLFCSRACATDTHLDAGLTLCAVQTGPHADRLACCGLCGAFVGSISLQLSLASGAAEMASKLDRRLPPNGRRQCTWDAPCDCQWGCTMLYCSERCRDEHAGLGKKVCLQFRGMVVHGLAFPTAWPECRQRQNIGKLRQCASLHRRGARRLSPSAGPCRQDGHEARRCPRPSRTR